MMRLVLFVLFGLAAAMMINASGAHATEPAVELQRNPFDRPDEVLLTNNNAPSIGASSIESGPLLRAVLAAGRSSVVNLSGIILRIGESADGYRLLSVEEGSATFSRDGEKVVLSLFEQEQAEDQ